MSQHTIRELLIEIYGDTQGIAAFEKIDRLIANCPKKSEKYQESFSPADVVLITYGDSLKSKTGEATLKTLTSFCNKHLKGAFSTVHLLPFFPYSSDDGFSVKDFYAIDDHLGNWDDVKMLGQDFKLMFDYVLNHISSQSDWFNRYLEDDPEFKELAIESSPETDLSQVTRPRSLPLLTKYTKESGEEVHLWTTFSDDQIDINFASIDILVKMIEVLLYYVEMGATILRLDAIAYLWKEIGTNCIHLKNTHNIVKLFRLILDEVAPNVMILTETNVPHPENISYFGDGKDEAQMVYNFTLPPLLLYSFIKENSDLLSNWVSTLKLDSQFNTFFNFTASHDGIGVRPLEGILSADELEDMVAIVKENGGRISYKRNSDGTDSPYEMNITYVDTYKKRNDLSDTEHAKRFLASQAIQLVLPGMPAIYIHSLLGSHNWEEGVQQTNRARTINREKLDIDHLEKELNDNNSFRSMVFYSYLNLIKSRTKQPAFHPKADFEVLKLHPKIFALKRICAEQTILCLTNLSGENIDLSIDSLKQPIPKKDLISGNKIDHKTLRLEAYETFWLAK